VPGRVNAVCFAPERPLLAIGTGSRRLVQWNFQTAAVEKVYQGLNHSIAEVAYVGSDTLVCGVRSNTNAACLIYGWSPSDSFVLPGHTGAVTALLPASPATLVSTGRDGVAILWNLADHTELARRDLPDWPRAARLSPDGQRLALLDGTLSLLQMPALTPIDLGPLRTVRSSGAHHSVGQCAAFAPGGPDLLVGQRNGQVVSYQPQAQQAGVLRKSLGENPAPVVALEFLPGRPELVTALASGQVTFSRWPDGQRQGSVATQSQKITSLHISPDGSFMATGTSDSAMLLWDLRASQLPALVAAPLASVSPEQHTLVSALLRCPGLPPALRPTLDLLHALLIHRFRYDIQISELPHIQPGEFDILLD
jgi:WD40 repeat protein